MSVHTGSSSCHDSNKVFNTCRIQSVIDCTEVTEATWVATWVATLLNQGSGEKMVGFSVLCSFQQCQVMFCKLCFLFSCALMDGHKVP